MWAENNSFTKFLQNSRSTFYARFLFDKNISQFFEGFVDLFSKDLIVKNERVRETFMGKHCSLNEAERRIRAKAKMQPSRREFNLRHGPGVNNKVKRVLKVRFAHRDFHGLPFKKSKGKKVEKIALYLW